MYERLSAVPVKVFDVRFSAQDHRERIEAVRVFDENRVPAAGAHAVNVGGAFTRNALDGFANTIRAQSPDEVFAAQSGLEREVHPAAGGPNRVCGRGSRSEIVAERQQVARGERLRIET